MQMRFFTVPVFGGEPVADELCRFLAVSRVVAIDRHLVQAGNNSAWAFCISYEACDAAAWRRQQLQTSPLDESIAAL